jgi:DNA-binding NarL/FixJ family response regulator
VGASGYLLKTVAVDELERALRTVAGGGQAFWALPARQVSEYDRRVGAEGEPDPVAAEAAGRLTVRQREVLVLIARGETTTAIAHQLSLSPKTVETHRMNLMNALDIHDVPGLTRFAIRAGLVPVN